MRGLGVLALGLAIGLALAFAPAPAPADASETQRLSDSAEIFVLNATSTSIDVYVNDEAQPSVSDPKRLVGDFANGDELGPDVLVVDGSSSRPYGSYTLTVRSKGDPSAAPLGEASVLLEQGHSYSAVFHPAGDGSHQLSIYENDLSPATDGRLVVRHTADLGEVSWRLVPNGEDPTIPSDTRSGSLGNAEWQAALDITDNDYRIEFMVDGQLVAMFPDIDLAHQKNIIVYLIGNPQPTTDTDLLLRPVAFQELEFDLGEPDLDVTTPAEPPLATTDTNAAITFECNPLTTWETNGATAQVSATDPDGMVTNLTIDRVEPHVGGVEIRDVAPSTEIGSSATATIWFKNDIPSGSYDVRVVANRGSLGEHAGCALRLTVEPITIARLASLTDRYATSGDIEPGVSEALLATLQEAQGHLESGDTALACGDLQRFVNKLGSEKGKSVTDQAADDLTGEAVALRSDIGC